MIVSTLAEALAVLEPLSKRKHPVCGIDCETEGIDPKVDPAAGPKGRIVCWTLSFDDTDVFIWANPVTWQVFKPILATLPVVGHNILGFDKHMFRKAGAPLGNIVADTMRQFKLVNPSEEASASLKSLMRYWLQIEPVGSFMELFTRLKKLEDVPDEGEYLVRKRKVGEVAGVPTLVGGAHSRVGSMRETIPLSELPATYPHLLETLVQYAKLDARATLNLYRMFTAKLEATQWEVPLMSSQTPASGAR